MASGTKEAKAPDKVDLFNAQEGTHKRLPGRYLDDVEREQAEKARARVEGREPDYDNLPGTAGVPLVRREALAPTGHLNGHSYEESEPVTSVDVVVPEDEVTDFSVEEQRKEELKQREASSNKLDTESAGRPANKPAAKTTAARKTTATKATAKRAPAKKATARKR